MDIITEFKIIGSNDEEMKIFLKMNLTGTLFTQNNWLEFINEDKSAKPIVVMINDSGNIGFFVCMRFIKFGFTFIGSPFSGWSTPYMGIVGEYHNLGKIYNELLDFLMKKYHPIMIEIVDQKLHEKDLNGFKYLPLETLLLDISISEEELFSNFKQDARNFIRQFEKKGSTIQVAEDLAEFSTEYYKQLIDVFDKQEMRPTYSKKKVDRLLNALQDTDKLLCLKVINPEGLCIATSIFVGYHDTFYFWGGASYRDFQFYRPNEYMIWYAIKYWKRKNFKYFDMVGVRKYKEKFGPYKKTIYRIYSLRNPFFLKLRNLVEKIYYKNLKQ